MKSRWLTIGLLTVLVLVVGAFAYLVHGLNNKYDDWQEDQINGALGTSLEWPETRGVYLASTARPDSAGFTYTDVIIEIESDAFAAFRSEAAFPAAWTEFDGSNPPLPAGGPDTAPWWREGDMILENKEWDSVPRGYQRVVKSDTSTHVFLLVPERRLLRWRHYVRSAV